MIHERVELDDLIAPIPKDLVRDICVYIAQRVREFEATCQCDRCATKRKERKEHEEEHQTSQASESKESGGPVLSSTGKSERQESKDYRKEHRDFW